MTIHSSTFRKRIIFKSEQTLIDFASNDTLGLAKDERVIKAFCEGAQKWGVGATASPIVCGSTDAHKVLEETLADALGFEAGLCFSSGYQANLALITYFKEQRLAIDRQMHASIWDGLKGHSQSWLRYRCAEQLRKRNFDFVLTEGVFSQTGRVADLPKLKHIADQKGARLYLDDAHGIGVLGHNGLGTLSSFGMNGSDVFAANIPLGKAFGCQGSVVLGSQYFIDDLQQSARPWIYSTALSPAMACAALKAFELIQTETWRQEKLKSNVETFKKLAHQHHLNLFPSQTSIQSTVINEERHVLDIQEKCIQNNLLVGTMQKPSVEKPIIRVVIKATHNEKQIQKLCEMLNNE